MPIQDDRTPNLGLPLPHYDNLLEDDEERLREALTLIDTALALLQPVIGYTPLDAAQKGAVNGVATLGGDGKVPAAQLPSYVDDVIEVANEASLPTVGEGGKIYVLIDTGRQFRWTGSVWFELHPSPGTTDNIVEGAVNKFFTATRALAAIPAASNSVLGLVKVGAGLGIDGNGLLYATAGGGSYMDILKITPASNGASSVTVLGGYVVGGIVVFLNGALLEPTDYTATDGALITFVGFTVNTTDTVVVVKLSTVQIGTLPAGSVGTSQLAALAVTLAKIQDGLLTADAPGRAKMGDGFVTPAKLAQPLTQGTVVNTTSGTYVDFTGIPSWAKRITVMFNGVSTNGSSNVQVQVGSGSMTTAGYVSTSTTMASGGNTVGTSTTGLVMQAASASSAHNGHMVLTNVSGNTWVASHTDAPLASNVTVGGGSITLNGALDRLRITTVNGSDTFDAGSVNIIYE